MKARVLLVHSCSFTTELQRGRERSQRTDRMAGKSRSQSHGGLVTSGGQNKLEPQIYIAELDLLGSSPRSSRSQVPSPRNTRRCVWLHT